MLIMKVESFEYLVCCRCHYQNRRNKNAQWCWSVVDVAISQSVAPVILNDLSIHVTVSAIRLPLSSVEGIEETMDAVMGHLSENENIHHVVSSTFRFNYMLTALHSGNWSDLPYQLVKYCHVTYGRAQNIASKKS